MVGVACYSQASYSFELHFFGSLVPSLPV